ncbi:hypothetical protein [Leptolyngbya sp. Heron Island J]|uniref:hypothetical protein n=1 Tax=Leptolyngbya sp. Heron Island J TaxID=1385935 RepID=UPI0012687E4C|nr:hypothetical protein [Leptolyngbya sp. Heron Island J]
MTSLRLQTMLDVIRELINFLTNLYGQVALCTEYCNGYRICTRWRTEFGLRSQSSNYSPWMPESP